MYHRIGGGTIYHHTAAVGSSEIPCHLSLMMSLRQCLKVMIDLKDAIWDDNNPQYSRQYSQW